jgi:hypothetical protein
MSSALLAALAMRGLRLPPRALGRACSALLQLAGLWLICFFANATIGILAIIAIRSLTPTFLSIYLLDDLSVVLVSGLQAFILQAWIWTSRS